MNGNKLDGQAVPWRICFTSPDEIGNLVATATKTFSRDSGEIDLIKEMLSKLKRLAPPSTDVSYQQL